MIIRRRAAKNRIAKKLSVALETPTKATDQAKNHQSWLQAWYDDDSWINKLDLWSNDGSDNNWMACRNLLHVLVSTSNMIFWGYERCWLTPPCFAMTEKSGAFIGSNLKTWSIENHVKRYQDSPFKTFENLAPSWFRRRLKDKLGSSSLAGLA